VAVILATVILATVIAMLRLLGAGDQRILLSG
jgi:hypothetical protein